MKKKTRQIRFKLVRGARQKLEPREEKLNMLVKYLVFKKVTGWVLNLTSQLVIVMDL